jgi:hypothetical protein
VIALAAAPQRPHRHIWRRSAEGNAMRIDRFLFATALALAALSVAAQAETRPVVVELFTSQGCSSCPPADALLAELAQRPEVIALGFHIDYWDNLGWRDPLSSPAATARQRDYARQFGRMQVYTPQLVVDGTDEAVGSNRSAVFEAVGKAKPDVIAAVAIATDRRSVSIAAGAGSGKVLLVKFAQRRTSRVGAGENAGRTLDDVNGVETLTPLGAWNGTSVTFPVEPPGADEGLAVLVQAPDGHILGAGKALGTERKASM